MKRAICSFFVLCSTLLGGTAHAECAATSCLVYVDQLYVEAHGNMYVQTSGTETLANCTPEGGVFFFLAGTATKFKEIYAMLLTAQTLGWQVRIRIMEGSNPCSIVWAAVDRQ